MKNSRVCNCHQAKTGLRSLIISMGLASQGGLADNSGPATGADWSPAQIEQSERALAATHKQDFFKCLDQQYRAFDAPQMDFRDAVNSIIGLCDTNLHPIRSTFTATDVPAAYIDHFLSRIRQQASRRLLPLMMQRQLAAQGSEPKKSSGSN